MELPTCSQIISLSVVPVVIISACGLLCLTFYNRLAVAVGRLRTLHRERLHEYKELIKLEKSEKESDKVQDVKNLLKELGEQTAHVMKRAGLLRNCLFCLLGTIGSLVLCSLMIGLNVYYPFLDYSVLLFFILGLLLLLFALLFAFLEMIKSLHPVRLESLFVERFVKKEGASRASGFNS
jgi:Flp pilus assembly protein TadB